MKLVVDANILFSSLAKEGLTRIIMLKHHFSLYSSKYIIEEIFEHLEELESKTNLKTRVLKGKIKEILRLSDIKMLEMEEFEDFLEKAQNITPDQDDTIYIALALKLNCAIWSNDKKLKEQNKVKVYSTEELIKIL